MILHIMCRMIVDHGTFDHGTVDHPVVDHCTLSLHLQADLGTL